MSVVTIATEQIVEEVFNVILHADLPGVMSGGCQHHATAKARALFSRCLAGAVESQREAPENGGHNPSGVAFLQKKAGSLPFFWRHRPVRQRDVIDQCPGNGVTLHGHLFHSVGVAMCGGELLLHAVTTVDQVSEAPGASAQCQAGKSCGKPYGSNIKRGGLFLPRVPAVLGDSSRGKGRGRFSRLSAPTTTLAGVCVFLPLGAIPGGRGGPQGVAPILPVVLPGGAGRAARLFAGVG